MRFPKTLVVGYVIALACSTQAAPQTLKLNLAPGMNYAFDNKTTLDMNLGLTMGGQQMTMQQAISQSMSGTIEVLEAVNGRPSKAKVNFAPTCGSSATMMGQQQDKPFALAGKTVTVTMNGSNLDIQPADGIDDETRKAVAELVSIDDGIYPTKAVDVGDEWMGGFGAAGPMQPKLKLKVANFSKINGRDVVELACSGDIAGVENGMNMSGTVSGPVVMDILTGLSVDGKISGDLKINGNTNENGVQVAIDGTGKMSVSAKNVIGAAGGVAPMPNNPTPAAGGNPLGGENPLAGVTAPTLNGLYAGDGLTMTVNGNNINLELGTSKLSGNIVSHDGNKFAGTFSSNGKTFDFTGIDNGTSVDFTTGSKTYKLKQQSPAAPANPLG